MRTKSEIRRQGIIDVACEVFREAGFEAASMSEIAARVGGSKATLYNYFSSKEELFATVMRQFAETHMQDAFSQLNTEADVTVTLQNFGENFLRILCQPDLICVHRNLMAEAGKSEVGRLFYKGGPLKGLTMMAAFMQSCMDLGKLRPANSFVAAQHFTSLLKAEIMERLMLGVQDEIDPTQIQPMVKRAVEVFVRGYITQPEEARPA